MRADSEVALRANMGISSNFGVMTPFESPKARDSVNLAASASASSDGVLSATGGQSQ